MADVINLSDVKTTEELPPMDKGPSDALCEALSSQVLEPLRDVFLLSWAEGYANGYVDRKNETSENEI